MPNEPVVWVVTIIIAVCVFLKLLHTYLVCEVWDSEGKNAAGKTRSILKRYAMLRNFKVLSNLQFETERGTIEVENVLIGFFGILIVHTCGMRGEYYKDATGEKWTVVSGVFRKSIENPHLQQQKAIAAMREIFAKNKIYKIPFEKVVFISSRSKKTAILIPASDELVLPGRLSSYLDKERFDNDANVDVEQLAGILEAYQRKN